MSISRVISLIVIFLRRHGRGWARWRFAACAVLAVAFVSSQSAGAATVKTIVRMETNLGSFHIGLYDDDAPETVRNFLKYVDDGAYDNTIIHRSIPGFVIQGGGYGCCFFDGNPVHIQTGPRVQNEFDPLRSNIRGTITMAKIGGDPDSATSEWFFNLADNSENLDYQNGGFTVFGSVLDSGMDVVDAIAALPTSTQSAYNETYQKLALGDFPKLGNSFIFVNRVCRNNDGDGVCSATENLAPDGDGNGDNVADSDQPNVVTILGALDGSATFSADTGMKFDLAGTIKKDIALSWLKTFTSPPNQSVYFNNGMFRFTMIGTMGTAEHVVALRDGATTRPTSYYAYGPTADNTAPHWYDFAFDGRTGAEIKNDRIILHFVDGERGDDDLRANDSITHTGAQAVVTVVDNGSTQGGGCSIVETTPDVARGGDWIVVSLFLTMLAFVRRRTRGDRNQNATDD